MTRDAAAFFAGALLYLLLFFAYQSLTKDFSVIVAAPGPVAAILPSEQPAVTVLFAGDMMFDRGVRASARKRGGDYLFYCIDKTLADADLVVANLEGPITHNSSHSEGSVVGSLNNYVFTFPTSTASLLAAHHIGLVNLGNNHIFNFGSKGVNETLRYLAAAGVDSFGDPLTTRVALKDIKGISIAFISYNEFGGNSSTTLEQIISSRAAGYLPVVFAHWGVEYAPQAPERLHMLARAFVDAGAIVVVGSHPHVVEESERYKGVPIYYSLGNFIFDQHFSNAVTHGLLLSVTVGVMGMTNIQEIPISIDTTNRPCEE